MPILRYIHIFLILLYLYLALFSLDWKELILEFYTEVELKEFKQRNFTSFLKWKNCRAFSLCKKRSKAISGCSCMPTTSALGIQKSTCLLSSLEGSTRLMSRVDNPLKLTPVRPSKLSLESRTLFASKAYECLT